MAGTDSQGQVDNRTVALLGEHNPRYYELFEKSNKLWKDITEVDKVLAEIRMPRVIPFRLLRQVISIASQISTVQESFNQWYKEASDFIVSPHIKVTALKDSYLDRDQIIGYVQYHSNKDADEARDTTKATATSAAQGIE